MTRASTTEGSAKPLKAKQPPHRDRKLLDLAHMVHECQNCGWHVEAGCEPAHENQGKGVSQKRPDHRHAAICHSCHAWLDQGGNGLDPSGRYTFNQADRRAMWRAAYDKTWDLYWRCGWIQVTP
jgi:hypothetical protein